MDKSTGSLIENVFEQRIRSAGRNSAEFKAAQVTSGASGQLAYDIENEGVSWDRTDTLPAVPSTSGGFGEYAFTVTYTGDGSQVYPVVSLFTDIRVNGTSEANKIRPRNTDFWTYGDPGTPVMVQCGPYAAEDPGFFTSQTQLRWLYYFMYNTDAPVTIYTKMRARGSSPGALAFARVL